MVRPSPAIMVPETRTRAANPIIKEMLRSITYLAVRRPQGGLRR